jgi:hypothetical protein
VKSGRPIAIGRDDDPASAALGVVHGDRHLLPQACAGQVPDLRPQSERHVPQLQHVEGLDRPMGGQQFP